METALDKAKKVTWGTYGPGAMEAFDKHGTPLPPIIWKPLKACDTGHLQKILEHVKLPQWRRAYGPDDLISIAVKLVLEDRLEMMT